MFTDTGICFRQMSKQRDWWHLTALMSGCVSEWRPVTGSVPQGVGVHVRKITNYTNIDAIVDSEEGYLSLQQNLDQLRMWGKEWKIKFNSDKCEVLHFGMLNQGRTCRVNGRVLESYAAQRYLKVQVHSSLKEMIELDRVVKKAFGILTFTGKGIEYKSWDNMLVLQIVGKTTFGVFVQFWSPSYRNDTIKLEMVLKSFCRKPPEHAGLS